VTTDGQTSASDGAARELPLVSAIMPAHNAQKYIALALDSVLTQTYKNIEVIVVDDGSTDTTAEIVQSYAGRNPRVTLLRQPNAGVASARNRAIEVSHGEYIAPIDADDIWYPEKIDKQVRYLFEAESNTGLVYGWLARIDKNGELTGGADVSLLSGDVLAALIYRNFLCCASLPLIHRECFERLGGYNTRLQEQRASGSEDHELYLRIAEHYQFGLIEEPLVAYRTHSSSMSCDYRSMERSHFLVIGQVRERHPRIPPYLLRWAASRYYMYLELQSRQAGHHWTSICYLCKAGSVDLRMMLYPDFRRRLVLNLSRIAYWLRRAAHSLDKGAGSTTRRRLALNEIVEVNNRRPASKLRQLYGRRLETAQKLNIRRY